MRTGYRAPFVTGFSNAAHGGFEVGAGQSGASLQLPEQVQAIAHYVFTQDFDAMHPTLVLPIVVLVAAAFAAAFARPHKQAAIAAYEEEAAVA